MVPTVRCSMHPRRARRAANALRAVACSWTLLLAACSSTLLLAACATPLRVGDDGLVQAERAFARLATEIGVRDAFIASFAPDGLVFEPAPVRVREAWSSRPAPTTPAPQHLLWEPALVVVAASGDLGFSTGPYRVQDVASGGVRTHGAFFSVWQRAPGAPWRVWLDMGASTPSAVDPATWSVVPQPIAAGTAAIGADAVLALDRSLSGLDADAFAALLARNARQHRDASVPLFATDWVAMRRRDRATATYDPVEARVSRAGDLAAVHGRVVRRAGDAATPGRYVHVWLRDGGAWRLAVEAVVDET